MSRIGIAVAVLGLVMLFSITPSVPAQVTPEHRKELTALSRDAGKIATHVRRKEFDDATKLIAEVETRLQRLSAETSVPLTDPSLGRILVLVERQRTALEKAMEKTGDGKVEEADPVSFMEDVAPILNEKCIRCHGENNPRNGLRLDRFAGMKAGGRSGPLLVIGSPLRSLIMTRINAPEGSGRMPAQGAPLTEEERKTLADWIHQGAKFDGASEDRTFADLIYEEESKNVKVPAPKGGETVLFTRDIAPWFTNLCLNCHNSRQKSGGLSVETFFDIMKGGDSGEVVIPGDAENSRLFRLVGGLELPRMPRGQARITRKNYEDLKKWFEEGNAFDGADPRAPIRSFVPSAEQVAAAGLAARTDAEMQELRDTRSEDQFRRAVSRDSHPTLKTNDFLLLGNVPEERLVQVRGWADDHLKKLKETFGDDPKPWRGRLAIFVLKDRFTYSEFNEVIERRRPDADLTGHSKVTVGQEDAYIVLQDLGDSATGASLQASLIDHLTGAYLMKSGRSVPGWLARGAGLALLDGTLPDQSRSQALQKTAGQLVGSLNQPEQVFADGTFSPSGTAAVGYTLTRYLLANGGPQKLTQFVKSLEQGTAQNAALQSVYGSPPPAIATGYLNSLRGR